MVHENTIILNLIETVSFCQDECNHDKLEYVKKFSAIFCFGLMETIT